MENASKALIMAGGVLITILVATLWGYVFKVIAGEVTNVTDIMESSEITEFNQQFLKYDGRGIDNDKYLNIHDVITIANISKNNDNLEKFPIHVIVYFDAYADEFIDLTTKTDTALKNIMLTEIKHYGNKDGYSCKVLYDINDNRFVGKVEIRKK